MNKDLKGKAITLAIGIGVALAVYIVFRYMLKIAAPFVIAWLLAYSIEGIVGRIARHLRGKKIAAATIVVTIATIIMSVIVGWLLYNIVMEIREFIVRYDYYEEIICNEVCKLCKNVDEYLGIGSGTSYEYICKGMKGLTDYLSSNMIASAINISFPVVVKAFAIIGVFFITIIATVIISAKLDKVREWSQKSVFCTEIGIVWRKLEILFRVYFRIELIIMLITAIICVIGLMLIHNRYAVVLGILIGLLDALPFFGTGTVLLPWALVYIIMGRYVNASVLVTIYVITYIIREFMETKLMGDKLGISPLTMLIVIYIGLVLYGLWGFILGPISYCIIKELIVYLIYNER